MPRTRALGLAAFTAATALTLSACGGAGSSNAPTDSYGAAPAASPAVASPAAAPADKAAAGALVAQQASELGTIVADADGFTLYRFDKDTAKPPKATCAGDCATKWPPFVVDPAGKLTLEGVDQSQVGLVQRPDGQSQLTIGGWPVYRFSGDTSPGATAGQGVGGTWFAVTPEGKKAPTAP